MANEREIKRWNGKLEEAVSALRKLGVEPNIPPRAEQSDLDSYRNMLRRRFARAIETGGKASATPEEIEETNKIRSRLIELIGVGSAIGQMDSIFSDEVHEYMMKKQEMAK